MRLVIHFIKVTAFLVPFLFLASCNTSSDHVYEDMVDHEFAADSSPKECRFIVIHTSDNRVPTKIKKEKGGKDYFIKVARDRGFPTQSYHFILYEDGQVDTLVSLNTNSRIDYWEKTCGVAGYNSVSVHIVYVGGRNWYGKCSDTRTEAQKYSMLMLISRLQVRFPSAVVLGHTDLNNNKGCPCFHVTKWLKDLKIYK